MPLYDQWYQRSAPVGDSDMYVMSKKAVGFDWLKKIIPTLRHASGTDPFTVITRGDVPSPHPSPMETHKAGPKGLRAL